MRWPPKKVIMALVIIAIILLIWSGRSTRDASADHLLERVWIDRVSDDPREQIETLFLVRDSRFGAMGRSSRFRIALDLLTWKLDGDRLSLEILQEDRTVEYTVKTWRCEPGESPHDELEYCMTMTGPEGTKKYFAGDEVERGIRALVESRHP